MRPWLKSPTLLKYLVGQHIVNGVGVAASVAGVSIAAAVTLGFGAGQPATLGAIGASISDLPAPWKVKAKTVGFGFALSIVSTIAIEIAAQQRMAEIPVIGALAFAAGIVTGFGRWALAINAQILAPMVFMLGLPELDASGLAEAEAIYIAGGLGYIALSLAFTALTAASDRRLMASEAFRELAAYLDAIARFTDRDGDLAEIYGAALRQRAALSEQLQAARAMLLNHPRASAERVRLAATIGILLDAFDALVATLRDLPRLRAMAAAATLNRRIGLILRTGARDLRGSSLSLLAHETPRLPPDRWLAFDVARRETARVRQAGLRRSRRTAAPDDGRREAGRRRGGRKGSGAPMMRAADLGKREPRAWKW
ncbi:MAG: FUSC family membrane protein [Roseiarcus sp.]